jgi:hypothetical protein
VCKKCKERDKSKTEGYDLPDGFSEIFGFGGKK